MATRMFHQGHYNKIVARIKEQYPDDLTTVGGIERDVLGDLARSLCRMFLDDNPDFDPVKFLSACGVEEKGETAP